MTTVYTGKITSALKHNEGAYLTVHLQGREGENVCNAYLMPPNLKKVMAALGAKTVSWSAYQGTEGRGE